MALLRKPLSLGFDNSVIRPAGVPYFLGDDIVSTDIGTTTTFTPDTTPAAVTYDYSQSGAQAGPAPAAPAAPVSTDWLGNVLNTFSSVTNAVATTIQKVAPAATSVIQQSQFNAVNAQRAARGLAPLTAAQYQTMYAMPTATVGVGLTPQTTKTAYIALGVVAAAVLGFAALNKR